MQEDKFVRICLLQFFFKVHSMNGDGHVSIVTVLKQLLERIEKLPCPVFELFTGHSRNGYFQEHSGGFLNAGFNMKLHPLHLQCTYHR